MANELVIPPDIKPMSGEEITLVDDQTFSFRPQFGRAWSQRNSFGDPRWQFKRQYQGMRMSDRARMHAVLGEVQGSFRTIMVSPAQEARGVFPDTELFTNSDFSSGTTGWTADSGGVLTVSDAVAKLTVNAVGNNPEFYRSAAAAAYNPYVLRIVVLNGLQSSGLLLGPSLTLSGTVASANYTTSRGYVLASGVTLADGPFNQFPLVFSSTSGYNAGAYTTVPFVSLSQCFLVDGGGNALLNSHDLQSWSINAATATNNVYTAPDGTSTADRLREDSGTSAHFADQSGARTSVAADITAFGRFRRGTGGSDRNVRLFAGNTSANGTSADFDLGAGTVSTTASTGTAASGRAFIVDIGSGWYFCFVVSRNVAASTIYAQAALLSGVNASYTGDGTSNIATWGLGATVSAVPTRGTTTTVAAVPAETQTGPGIYVKGLPVSTSDLLLQGDWVEIDGQLKELTTSLNSDAAGLGYLQVRPQIVRAVADNTPVIVTKPMGRFVLAESAKWNAKAGLYCDYSLTLDEVYE